jgi:hypothetical protein
VSTTDPTRTRPPVAQPSGSAAYRYQHRGDSWVMFAGVMMLIAGALNTIDGIAAIGNSAFFVDGARFIIFDDLNTWGWVMTVLGIVQILVAFGVWTRMKGVRWVAVAIAAVNGLAQMLFISAYPLWAIAVFTIDVLIIYALVAYGARQEA